MLNPAVVELAEFDDGDGDGVGDLCDNCILVANEDQADADLDGVGDACEGTDDDNDGLANDADNCPDTANAGQADADEDGVGDDCDNCPEDANPDQADGDVNGIGDACESTTLAKYALEFDGFDDVVVVPDSASLDSHAPRFANMIVLAAGCLPSFDPRIS